MRLYSGQTENVNNKTLGNELLVKLLVKSYGETRFTMSSTAQIDYVDLASGVLGVAAQHKVYGE